MREIIKKAVSEAVVKVGYSLPKSFSIEVPPKSEMGDYATNIPMIISGRDKQNPREVAAKILDQLKDCDQIKRVEIAGPGFINISLKDSIYYDELKKILIEKENYGKGNRKKTKVLVEYVSANPTGPLHVGNARGGPIGEALANLFSFSGYESAREFYVNDVGGQIERFAESLYYWFAKKVDPKIEFPDGGYPGEYIKEISEQIQQDKKEDLSKLKDKAEFIELFKKEGLYHTIKSIREDCELIGIKFDKWINQSDFEYGGKSDQVIAMLKENGFATQQEGALWFKNPDDPELNDKESVLVKSDGKTLTYFADDIAYHKDKIERGYSLLIDIWGANHHGHVDRLKASLRALGLDSEALKIVLYQYVRLKNAGKVVSMGKRLGNFVTLRQVIESGVDPDAFKYFVLAQNPNTPFDFDLKLAADTSEKNPVFYIKYAHARICSILERAGDLDLDLDKVDFKLLKDPREITLLKEIIKFSEVIAEAEKNFQIQTLPHYAYKIATLFHEFYNDCRVLTEDKKLSSSRLSLALATKYILASSLNILGIEAPEKM